MTATFLTNEPGTCEPRGGKPLGDVKLPTESAHTFCCQDPWTAP